MMRPAIIALAALIIFVTVFSRGVADRETKINRSFAVNKGGTLEVSIGGGDIRITTWEKNEVTVSVKGLEDDKDRNLKISQTGDTIRVVDLGYWSEVGFFDISIPSHFNLNLKESFVDISIKGKVTGDIMAKTSAGDVMIGDVDGNIDVRTSWGDVRAGRINGKGSLATADGKIDVISATNELDLNSSGGNIRVGNVGKSLRAKTAAGGNIRVGNVGKSLHAKTAAGNIVIGDVGGDAVASTAGGNVRVGKISGRATLNTTGGNIELNGGNGIIKAYTSGGNMMLTNISGSVTAKTFWGDIHTELVPSGKGESRLSTASGVIMLFLPENAKASITARIRTRGWRHSQQDEYKIRSDFKEESSLRSENDQKIESKYVLNGGGESITLETVNSNIEIRTLKK